MEYRPLITVQLSRHAIFMKVEHSKFKKSKNVLNIRNQRSSLDMLKP